MDLRRTHQRLDREKLARQRLIFAVVELLVRSPFPTELELRIFELAFPKPRGGTQADPICID